VGTGVRVARGLLRLGLVLAALAAAGCGGGGRPPTTVALSALCNNDGRDVVVEGYFRFPERLRISTTTVIDVFSEAGGEGDRRRIELAIGDGPNQLREPGATYTPTSLRVTAADGADVTINDRVRITAEVARDDTDCLLRRPVVERITRT
jgi:hypothetical protein